jgi:hypothetical protein
MSQRDPGVHIRPSICIRVDHETPLPPFEYLVALLQHPDQVRVTPSAWMPWNYQQSLAHRKAGADPPPPM